MRTLLCAIAKMENHYIREWVEWYKNIGFTNICLYDNNDPDGEHFEEVIGDYIDNGFVIVKDVRGVEKMPNGKNGISLNVMCYDECYQNFQKNYDWIAFFDIDEFLELENVKTISELLTMKLYEDFNCIKFSWKYFDDNDLIEVKDNNYSVTRFTRHNDFLWENMFCKVIVKCINGVHIDSPHGFGETNRHAETNRQLLKVCNADGTCGNLKYENKPIYKNGWLNHYRFKTLQEFLDVKAVRGWPDDYGDKIKMTTNLFFKSNNYTPQKKEYLLNRINMKTLLCCIGRNENLYIREFVEYYKSIGFTNICLYDNNKDEEEHFEDVIGDYIDNGFVILKNYRNKTSCQIEAYQSCYNEYNKEYDWIAFFDCDEFLTFTENKTISEYITDEKFNDSEMICLNWLCYGDGDSAYYRNEPVLNRIAMPVLPIDKHIGYNFPENFHIKVIVRGNIDDLKFSSVHYAHRENEKIKSVNNNGQKVEVTAPFLPFNYKSAYLRHYSTKTAQEYCNKMKRGFPDREWNMYNEAKYLIETRFFRYNKATPEKVQIFKDELGIDMSYLLPGEGTMIKSVDTQIYSLCFTKKDFKFLNDAVVTPLQVGAANGTDVCKTKDNTGENISQFNYFFVENTGTFWIWKNVNDAKYKGQMQYRRPLQGVDENMNFDEIFKKYDVITCEPFHHPDHKQPTEEDPMFIPADTVEQGYGFSNCIDDLYILEMVVKLNYPEYAEDWDKYIKNGADLYYSNGFILKAEDFDRYAQFSFNCLNHYLNLANIHSYKDLVDHVKYNLEVGKYIRYPNNKYSQGDIAYQTRIGGYLSERIWTLWLLHNFSQEKILKLPYVKQEENQWI